MARAHRIVLYCLLLFLLVFLFPQRIFASDFQSTYQVEYFLNNQNNSLASKARFTIAIVNTASDRYVKKFSLSFPKSFRISNVKANDDHGSIQPTITVDSQKTNIELEFSDPATGKGSINHLYLLFDQSNLFQDNGNIWEVMLPTFEDENRTSYDVLVHLPDNSDKKLSIAKPKPDSISGTTITWHNPTTKTIYAVFGDTQIYTVNLTYHLKNPKIAPIFTEVAFPPDTMYQKIILSSVNPLPYEVYRDEDGNLMGKYFLKPKEELEITVREQIQLSVAPRQEALDFFRSAFNIQKKYLLSSNQYWQISNLSRISGLQTPQDIFQFTVKTLSYNFARLNSTASIRYGAEKILQNTNQAVCVDYSDLFIATAREKGIYSREIEGYGFSQDPQLRPLSLASDILHSWPEYYDTRSQLWIPVDPTWESTSGIDYFRSFDLNHITFVVHGKKPDYPVPAGMYKTDVSKDVSIVPTKEFAPVTQTLKAEIKIPEQVTEGTNAQISVSIINTGNIYQWNIPIRIYSDDITFSQTETIIPVLAPMEKIILPISLQPRSRQTNRNSEITVYRGKEVIVQKNIRIVSILWSIIIGYIAPTIGVLIILFCLITFLQRRRRSV